MKTRVARERTYAWSDPRIIAGQIAGARHLDWLRAMTAGEIPPPPFAQTLEMRMSSVQDGRISFEMPLREWMTNPAGLIHGGMTATILDSALTLAVMSKLPAGKICTTLDLNVHYVRPLFATGETVTAEGIALHVGTTVGTAEGRVYDARGRLIAHATASLAIIEPTRFQAPL